VDQYANFEMRFTVPKNLTLVSMGTPVKQHTEGPHTISEWRTDEPQRVCGFHLGEFKKQSSSVKEMALETYANSSVPDWLQAYLREREGGSGIGPPSLNDAADSVGSVSTLGMAKKAMAEAQLASGLYTDYFGANPFKRLALTQQTADNYGQSWPQLIWLPLSYFLDSTIRHQIYGFDPRGYFKVVGPHEIAHQWWGHTVGWASYRDQWMSEGFSEMSASLFLQTVYSQKEFIKFWDEEREAIVSRNSNGFRPIDAGPLTLGHRLNNTKVGNVSFNLIYPKGGYVLHMLRMMMWNPKTGDADFKTMMRDFVGTYRNRAASTEDFKAIVEKHMTNNMNMAGNGRMDWFFDEYVYGTALPSYQFQYTLEGSKLKMKITQSGVDDNFMMPVPLYLEMADGRVVRLGTAKMRGSQTITPEIELGQLKPKRALINYNADVLYDKLLQH
jgi:aminopeptidase N